MDVAIQGPVGSLAGVLWEPEGAPRAAGVLAHPHPRHGGTMDSNVVFRAARAMKRLLRFSGWALTKI